MFLSIPFNSTSARPVPAGPGPAQVPMRMTAEEQRARMPPPSLPPSQMHRGYVPSGPSGPNASNGPHTGMGAARKGRMAPTPLGLQPPPGLVVHPVPGHTQSPLRTPSPLSSSSGSMFHLNRTPPTNLVRRSSASGAFSGPMGKRSPLASPSGPLNPPRQSVQLQAP